MNTPVDWIDLPGSNGYQVNYEGQIRKLFKSGLVHHVEPFKRKTSYKSLFWVSIKYKGKKGTYSLAKIVADTFLGPCPKGYVVIHRNGCASDNCAGNLKYVTRKKSGEISGALRRKRKSVVKIDKSGEIVDVYPTAKEAAANNHLSYSSVLRRCNKKIKKPHDYDGYNYLWETDSLYK